MNKRNPHLADVQRQFFSFYESNLRHIYSLLEPKRQKYLHQFYNRLSFSVTLCMLVFGLCYFGFIPQYISTSELFTDICSLGVLIMLIAIALPFSNYCEETKSAVMKKLLSFWGDFEYYNQRKIIPYPTIKQSELFGYFTNEETDDVFSGTYKNTSLCVSEHQLYIKGRKGDIYTFRGIFILLKFNKKFKSKTVVKNKGRSVNLAWNNLLLTSSLLFLVASIFLGSFYSANNAGFSHSFLFACFVISIFTLSFYTIYRIYRFFKPLKATQPVILEGIPFLNKWNVYTNDQIEARCILTPKLMENMLVVKKLFHGKHLDFSFFGSNLLIAIHTRKDLFETTALFTPALRYKKVGEVVKQLYSIFSTIDILDIPDSKTPTTQKNKSRNPKKI